MTEHGVRRLKETIAFLQSLIADLSVTLADEPADFTPEYIIDIRHRVANALPRDKCPDWLLKYQYHPMVHS